MIDTVFIGQKVSVKKDGKTVYGKIVTISECKRYVVLSIDRRKNGKVTCKVSDLSDWI